MNAVDIENENMRHGGAGERRGGRKGATVRSICLDNPEEAAESIMNLCVNERLTDNAKQLANCLQTKLLARESKKTRTSIPDVNSDEGLTELADLISKLNIENASLLLAKIFAENFDKNRIYEFFKLYDCLSEEENKYWCVQELRSTF